MVSRTRFRTALTTLGLYLTAAALIGYFGMHAFTGNRGLKAKQDLAVQLGELSTELNGLKQERIGWQRRVALLRSESLDPDMLDERARAMLDYVHPRDLVLLGPRPTGKPAAIAAAR
ncbi:MAG: septum formation initiator family protein [Rhizobiales bacterium]|nr:septum formation initiator family protein [Hyphomicrobiales bacterium]